MLAPYLAPAAHPPDELAVQGGEQPDGRHARQRHPRQRRVQPEQVVRTADQLQGIIEHAHVSEPWRPALSAQLLRTRACLDGLSEHDVDVAADDRGQFGTIR